MRSTTAVRSLSAPKWSPLPFLCPSLSTTATAPPWRWAAQPLSKPKSFRRCVHVESSRDPLEKPRKNLTAAPTASKLPLTCPGCGAYSQTEDASKPGYYGTNRRPVRAYIAAQRNLPDKEQEDEIFDRVAEALDESAREELGVPDEEKANTRTSSTTESPSCNRCHDLLHHNAGAPISHPNMSSLQDIIAETPHKYNHIYHVMDAADFPMSLIPRIHTHLDLTPQRSRNRRSSAHKYKSGRSAELSFIITRSDLLAPKKEQVDRMMPVLTDILRDALGRDAQDVRLGNVRCVSSKRGWWTKEVKEDIRKRGGAQWMVGKVNVGKSNLFESVFPKGGATNVDFKQLRQEAVVPGLEQETLDTEDEPDSLSLPPAAPEVSFPTMPTVSHLPGTTAQPIRLRFGGGRGELIDLPGLDRRDLTNYVLEERQQDLVMRSRERAIQHTIKPGQSLLIGDLIRITPVLPSNAIFLAAAFVPLETHVTNTEKATAIQHQDIEPTAFKPLLKPGEGKTVQSAGWFELTWDVTRQRAGPLTRKDAVGLRPDALSFKIYSADILIEGIGWVEIAVQVRRREFEQDISPPPMVEVFSPMGKHVSSRQPLGAYMLGGQMRKPTSRRTQRPRQSMKGVKKAVKVADRQLNGRK